MWSLHPPAACDVVCKNKHDGERGLISADVMCVAIKLCGFNNMATQIRVASSKFARI